MNDDFRPGRRQRRRGRLAAGGGGARPSARGPKTGCSGPEPSLTRRTTTRAFLALGAYAAQDLRDPDGVTRPLLRRGALRLVASSRRRMRQLGDAYLRLDPPTPNELGETGVPEIEAVIEPDEAEDADLDAVGNTDEGDMGDADGFPAAAPPR